MDLRKRVDGILKKWGHHILLQRRIKSIGQGPFGLRENGGFARGLERHTVRERLPGVGSLTGVTQERLEGKVSDVDMIFYFRWNANPDEGDRIYDKNPNGTYTYLVDWSMPMRFEGGRIEYWIVGATQENKNTEDNRA